MSDYDWSKCLPEIVPEVDWSGFSEEQMKDIEEQLDVHISMTEEIYSYTVPSGRDLEDSRIREVEERLVDNHKYEVDWRDKEIKRLKDKVDELYSRLDRVNR